MNEFDWTHLLAHLVIAFWCALFGYIVGYKRGSIDKQRLIDMAFDNGWRNGEASEQAKQKSMAKFISESPWV